jgi:hypothetical protein
VTIAILAIATILGFIATLWGIVGAYTDALRDVAAAEERAVTRKRLESYEKFGQKLEDSLGLRGKGSAGRIERSEARFAEKGLIRTTYANLQNVGAVESGILLKSIVESTRSNLVLAGLGLATSTLASLGSLFV